MKKIFMTLAAFLCCTMAIHAQLLYRISGNRLTEPSYILGTCHTADVSFVDSIPGLRKTMKATKQVYGETDMNAKSEPTTDELDKFILLPKGMTLDSLLSADDMKRLTAFMIDSCKMDSDKVELYFDLKPFPLAIYLSLKCDGFDKTKTSDSGLCFDDYFQKEALAQGKEIGGLETANLQYKLICEHFSLNRQKELLMCMVNNHKRPEEKGGTLKTYYSQDLDAIWREFNDNIDEDCGYTSQETVEMLGVRNLAWMKKIPSVMNQKPTLFVVGVLHLPGSAGVLNLLRKAGYTVEAVIQ